MANAREITGSFLTRIQDCELSATVSTYWKTFKDLGYVVPYLGTHVAASVGKGAHAGVDHLMSTKLQTGTMSDPDEAAEAGAEVVRSDFGNGVEIDETTRNRGEAVDQVARIVRTYAGLVGYKTTPLLVEQRLTMKLDKIRAGWSGSGKVDIYTADFTIPDLKTGSLRFTPVAHLAQLGFYSLLHRANKNRVHAVGTISIPRQPLSEDPARPVEHWYDRPTAERVAWHAVTRFSERFEKFLVSGDIYEFNMNPSSFFCKESACAAFAFCPYGRSKKALNVK